MHQRTLRTWDQLGAHLSNTTHSASPGDLPIDLQLTASLGYRPHIVVPRLPNARVLDLGCGDGLLSAQLIRRDPLTALVALDESEVQLARAAERPELAKDQRVTFNHARFGLGRLSDLGQFDAVFSVFGAMQYVSYSKGLPELWSLMKLDGVAILSLRLAALDNLKRTDGERLVHQTAAIDSQTEACIPRWQIGADTLLAQMKATGFEVTACREEDRTLILLAHKPITAKDL